MIEKNLLTGGDGGGRGAESYDRKTAWPSIYHSFLSVATCVIASSVEISRGFLSHVGYWTGHEDYYDHAAQELYGDVVSASLGS
jgi:hypothetical protein